MTHSFPTLRSSDLRAPHHPASCILSWRYPRPCMSGSCRREPAPATVSLSVEHRLDIASDHPGWRCPEQPHMPKNYPTLQRGSIATQPPPRRPRARNEKLSSLSDTTSYV